MSYFQEGNKLYNSKNYLEALDYYEKSIKLKENLACSYYNAGVCLIKTKDYLNAITYIKKAIDLSEDSKYYFNLAYSYAMLNNTRKALLYFNRAWSLNSKDEDCEKAINLLLKKVT